MATKKTPAPSAAAPVYSMTGYASVQHALHSTSAAVQTDDGAPAPTTAPAAPGPRLGLEIRAVNSRFLDLSFRLPDELRAHEASLRTLLSERLKRGKVEVRAVLEADSNASIPQPSSALLQRLAAVQEQVRTWLPQAGGLSVHNVLQLAANGAGNTRAAQGQDLIAAALPAAATQAITALLDARAREGERLAAMLRDRVAQLHALAEQAAPLVPQLVQQQQQRFLERWNEALALAAGASPASTTGAASQTAAPAPSAKTLPPDAARDRALAEAAAFAIRIDVAEELTRLRAHLDEITRLLSKGGEIGKRLDFLIQELHREANTLGSKSATLELTRISVDMKVFIEQMREQVQNIE